MIRNFEEMLISVKERPVQTVVVAAAEDDLVLEAVHDACEEGIVQAILVGSKEIIDQKLQKLEIDSSKFEIIDVTSSVEDQCSTAVDLLMKGEAQILMKGMVNTGTLLKAVLKEKEKLLTSPLMCHLSVFSCENYPKLLFASDAGMIIAPDLNQKALIIKNAVEVMHTFGIQNPKVAVLCAKEQVDAKMQATVDAEALQKMNLSGEISDCTVSGPIAMDGAVNLQAAQHKGMVDPVAGEADMLLMPCIESGNIFYKTMVYLAKAQSAGVIIGAKHPIVLTSRSDSAASKIRSIALAALISHGE